MHPEKVKLKDGKARKTNNICFETNYLNEGYKPVSVSERILRETGLLIVFELEPKKENLPRFIGRWDEKADTLDIDIENVNWLEKRKFKKEKNGFKGHHPERLMEEEKRTFKIDIEIPRKKILEGKLYLSLHREIEFQENLSITDFIKTHLTHFLLLL